MNRLSRSSPREEWRNWTRDERCAPLAIERPVSTAQLASMVFANAYVSRVLGDVGA